MSGFTVTFASGDGKAKPVTTTAESGETLLKAAWRAGAEIEATCGERGRCRSCRVKVLKGEVSPPTIMDTVQLGHEEVQERFRLGCQARVTGDCSILIAPPKAEVSHKILAIRRSPADDSRLGLDSGVVKSFIKVTLPDDENHQSSDIEEIVRELPVTITAPTPIDILRKIPRALREADCEVTVTTFNGEIIEIEPGDTTAHKFGMAFDIGTTSIVGSLLDLDSGAELASVGGMNPQAAFGGDLMSRIAFVQEEPKRLQTLRAKVLNAVNGFVQEACEKAGVGIEHVHKIVVVGNSCMHHIFAGIDPTFMGLAPYAPSVREELVMSGRDALLKSVPNARVCLLPLIAGFVGADTVACMLSTRIYESETMRCLVDIGTNGEVVMGNKDRLIACSAPAGPALEGAQIRHGMRGALGAIERVTIDDDVSCQVIGGVPPIGICGSGLIDAIAAMSGAGILNERGLIRAPGATELPEKLAGRLRHRDNRDEFVLTWAEDAGKPEDVTLNQSDVRQLQLAKGAICSGVMLLQKVLGLSNDEVDELMLCGGFGNYISTASAVRIRILPDIPLDRITYYGNAAGLGAQMALLSETERARANELANRVEHVSLATHPSFQDIFVEALKFPAAGFVPRETRVIAKGKGKGEARTAKGRKRKARDATVSEGT
ncbi:MAG: DUF4445 domain-containing protein [Rhizobiales bacterium]|nr:DUF4445 domain-containing protein [Hyphomicrobiales bacterium]